MSTQPDLPVPISNIDGKYLLYDIETVTWLRKHHNICGVFIGTLPQNPAQNVFLGLPLEIMPEEARLLVEKGVGYIIDDQQAHNSMLNAIDLARRNDYLNKLRQDAEQITTARTKEKEAEKAEKMRKGKMKMKSKNIEVQTPPEVPASGVVKTSETSKTSSEETVKEEEQVEEEETNLFDSVSTIKAQPLPSLSTTISTSPELPNQPSHSSGTTPVTELSHSITPTTTPHTLLPQTDNQSTHMQPDHNFLSTMTPSSYALYRHLRNKGYFTTPGLRFGCNFTVYPGDPLRFHSHFLATACAWDEEQDGPGTSLDLMDIVGGGRLGTGVKKAWLVGGLEPVTSSSVTTSGGIVKEGKVRTFSVEWAGM